MIALCTFVFFLFVLHVELQTVDGYDSFLGRVSVWDIFFVPSTSAIFKAACVVQLVVPTVPFFFLHFDM